MDNGMFLVRIGDAEFGTTASDHVAKFQRVTGWHGLTESMGRLTQIPGTNGAFVPAEVLRRARPITVVGYVRSSGHASAVNAIDELAMMLSPGTTLKMGVLDSDEWWSRQVVVDGFYPEDPSGTGFARFTIDLTSPDPVRYREWLTVGPVGLPTQVGGLYLPAAFPWDLGESSREVAKVPNDGSVPVLPRVTVEGSADSITVFGGPRRLEFDAFSGTLVFDSLERRAFLNGADVTRQLIRRDWPVVEPGAVADFYFQAADPSPDLSLLVQYRIGAW